MRHHLPPRHVPAAAGSASAPLVRGAARTGRVVATTRLAAFIEMDDPPPERGDVADQPAVLALIDPEAVRLPCSLVLSEPLPPLHNGAVAVLGADRVCVGGMRISPSRWWRVPRPAPSRPGGAVTRAATSTSLPDADVLPTEAATASTRLMSALNCPAPVTRSLVRPRSPHCPTPTCWRPRWPPRLPGCCPRCALPTTTSSPRSAVCSGWARASHPRVTTYWLEPSSRCLAQPRTAVLAWPTPWPRTSRLDARRWSRPPCSGTRPPASAFPSSPTSWQPWMGERTCRARIGGCSRWVTPPVLRSRSVPFTP